MLGKQIKIQNLTSNKLRLRGERDKGNYRYILLSCILAVITRHNGALRGKVPDVPEAIRKASQEESHLKNGGGEVCQKDKEME